MGRQRNRPQMKVQEKSEEDLEASNLTHRAYRVMIIWILDSMKKT